MKFGCMGCFLLLLILAIVLGGGAIAVYYAGSLFDMPSVPRVEYTATDGHRAQQKLFELARRETGRAHPEPVVLTERELNAFLARHLEESQGIPFSPLVVRLLPGTIEVQGRTMLFNLFQGFPFSMLAERLPASTLDRPVWVTVSGTIQMQRRRSRTEREYGRLRVSEFSLGNQDLGPWILSLMLGGKAQSLLQWQLPPAVDSITVEQGRMLITTRR